ncbi:tyrosine-protein phosphatase non-receptor type 23b [Engraulis encrasicolus]|uniref:tyrosine-protein phosphatase non-receptor type 23b n=1 Tax=Engraulis encrasicolus TaxID=184585 RepID=UPI002FD3EBBC
MEAVPKMPMISLDLKKAGDFNISHSVREFIRSNYSESPEDYSEPLKRLDQLRQSVGSVARDFEGCSVLRRYLGQLHFLQSRVPMAKGQQAAVPVTWTDSFSGKAVSHNDIRYEQACVLYNLGALHSALGATDNRISEEGMKVSCTHFQCAAGSFAYLRDHYSHSYSSDMSTSTLSVYINLMLAQAQECLLEKSLLDNRKSFLIARICAQVSEYYKQCVKAMDASESGCVLGKKEKECRKLISMKISYFTAITQLHMGKQSEEQQKYGEAVAYLQNALDKLNEAIKLSKGQPDSVQEALRFSMDVIGGKFNSAKKDNDFIYHETVPALDTLNPVKGASLVKALPVAPTDPSVTGPDLFSKLVPMAAHEASSLYSEEKAKLLREVVAKVEHQDEALEQFMDSLSLECVSDAAVFGVLPETLMEKCAAFSVKDNAVQSLVKAMQELAGVNAEVEEKLGEVRAVLAEEAAAEKSLGEVLGQKATPTPANPAPLEEVERELRRYEEAHADATHTNTELHTHMSQHLPNLRLLQGPLQTLRDTLPTPTLAEDDNVSLQQLQRILGKVNEMRGQRASLVQQLRDLIHKDDITGVLVTTERAQMKVVFEEQLQKYSQLQLYIQQNLSAQENILKALTEANVRSAPVRKHLQDTHTQWESVVQGLLLSAEAYEELLHKAEEGRGFYQGLLGKGHALLERANQTSRDREQERLRLLDKAVGGSTAPKLSSQKPLPLSDRGSSPSSLPDSRLAGASLPNPALLPRGGGPSGPLSWPPGVPPAPAARLDATLGQQQRFNTPGGAGGLPQMPPQARLPAPMHKHPGGPGGAPSPQPPGATAGSTPTPTPMQMPPFRYALPPQPWQQAPGNLPRHPTMPGGGYMPPAPHPHPHMGQNIPPRPTGQVTPPPPHLAPQYPGPPPRANAPPAAPHPQGPNAPHVPLGPPLQQYMPPPTHHHHHQVGLPPHLMPSFPGHGGHPGMPLHPAAPHHHHLYQPPMPGQSPVPPSPGMPPQQGATTAPPHRVPAPGPGPGHQQQQQPGLQPPLYPPHHLQPGMAYMPPAAGPSPSPQGGYPPQMPPFGYPGAPPPPRPGGMPMQGGGMMPMVPGGYGHPQPHMQPHPNYMPTPPGPAPHRANAPLPDLEPPPHLQQPLVPQQVGAPSSSGATVTAATGPQPGSLPPNNNTAPQPPPPPPGSQEPSQGPLAATVPDGGAPQLGMMGPTEGSLPGAGAGAGAGQPDALLQAKLEQLSLQPPGGAIQQPAASQPGQPINGAALSSLHQLEQRNGVDQPAPEGHATKHMDILSDLDPFWSHQKS